MQSGARRRGATSSAEVSVTEFRGNLAKYLHDAKCGRSVVILERGKRMYLVSRLEKTGPSIFGCMREHTELAQGEVVHAVEDWRAGKLP